MANDPRKYENMATSGARDEEEAPKRKKFNIFDRMYGVDGPGVDKDELRVLEDPSLINFFKLTWRKLWKLFSVNLIYIFGNFPLLFLAVYLSKWTQIETAAPAYSAYSALYGTVLASPSPVTASLVGIYGRTGTVYLDTPLSKVFFYASFLVVLTFGIINVGCTRQLRTMVREEPMFFRSDFFEAIKKNWKQAMIFGAFDCVICALLAFDVVWFNANTGGMMTFFLIVSWGMIILYAMMRMYIYLMMITFDLSIPKLLKNALIFAALGIKRNLLALLGSVVVFGVCWALISFTFPLGFVAFLILPFGLSAFMCAYAAYPKIKEVMIDPYYDKDGNPKKTAAEDKTEAS